MDLLNDMKSGNHDMKTKNKQNPGNKQKLAFGQFCLLPGFRNHAHTKNIKPGEFDIA